MENFWKITMLVLISVILSNVISRQEKDIAVLLSMVACCLAAMAVMNYLGPVFDFLRELEDLGQLQEGILEILLKAAGIALITEITGLICNDTGNSSLAKTLHMLGSASILYLSIPLYRTLLTLIQEILGQL